jgi:hypothetical protein
MSVPRANDILKTVEMWGKGMCVCAGDFCTGLKCTVGGLRNSTRKFFFGEEAGKP